ncbi:lysosomal alpha-mannosidase isoform X1 [Polistes fuscatus]|uniref:lysosomal alpha-mannosidase isoform X1 n=1 Tax=Polistes fuscatus TaxID=30207 RepID=UPI001CA977AE|nr:lysosomal alpha-mannosidase isoform X1 [Polistes fuscatus]
MSRNVLLLLFLFSLALYQLCLITEAYRILKQLPEEEKITCGYQSCPAIQSNKLNIHLVPHTHDDVGWLKTVDQYYFGSRSKIQKAGVQYILDSVIEALLKNPDRRFIYVETAFFWKWWLRQNDNVKKDVRMLINTGRLEIIGGAWSMNDEAVTHYQSIIDQFTWGFRRLNDTFGNCARPHIGWQIDPFGHSREQASLFAQMGFDGMLFGRLDYQDKSQRLRDKSMEFIWKASSSLGDRANLFTAAMFNTYSPPPGFCFDVLCDDEPVIDDPDSPDSNVPRKVEYFLAYVLFQARFYNTNNVIITMGDDFNYQQAEMWFANLDKLIKYGNELNGSTVNLIYSTPSCYLKALHDANINWPTKSDDFFPYASDPHAYWTGYFTSRPTIKYFERMGNNLLQISKQLSVLSKLKYNEKELEQFREAMGVMQHHDAVTGTEKQLVANDYARLLYENVFNIENNAAKSIYKWANHENSTLEWKLHSCLELNISSCVYTENNTDFIVIIYNPQSQPVSPYIRLPVNGNSYEVLDSTVNVKIVSQIVPIPERVLQIPGRESKATKELVFRANDLPPLGYKAYEIRAKSDIKEEETLRESTNFIGGDLYTITVDESGHIAVQYNDQSDMNFVQSFHYYEGAEGNNKVYENRSSGAYIFRPKTSESHNFVYKRDHTIVKGPLVEEIHQNVNEWISQVVRVYKQEERIEFEWLIGPIPVEDKQGKEIVTKYTSNLNSDGEFYTDSNGRETLKRKRDYRPTWNLKLYEPIAGNYYPITTKMYLKDKNKPLKLSVFTDRSQGGTSMKNGELELMLHRRLLKDDAFGVGEALNEVAYNTGLVVRGIHYVYGGSTKNLDDFTLKEKKLTLELALRPSIFVLSSTQTNIDNWRNTNTLKTSGLAKPLPPNIHILTLEPWKNNTILLRLEHLFEAGEAMQWSAPVDINIKDLFALFKITSIRETTLGANQWLEDNNRFKWNSETNDILNDIKDTFKPIEIQEGAINIHLKPMEIRTFILEVSFI